MKNTEYKNTRFTTFSAPRPKRPQLSLFRAPLPDSSAARIARAAAIEVLG